MAAFAMHRKTTAAFVQFEPCVQPQPDIEFYAVVWAASHRVEMPPDRRRARAAGAAWPDLTFKTLSVTIAVSVCFFRATRDVTNRRYFVISTGNRHADPGTSNAPIVMYIFDE